MKLLSYGLDHHMEPRLAFSVRGYAVDVMRASLWMKENRNITDYLSLPSTMKLALQDWTKSFGLLKNLEEAIQRINFDSQNIYGRPLALPENDIAFFAPIPDPPCLRYFFASESSATFLFGNTQTLLGHNQEITQTGLSMRGEMGAVIAGKGVDLEIAGYCAVNNLFDAEINPNEGLAHGIATSLGPYLVTADEMESHKLGNGFNLDMQIRKNGTVLSEGRFNKMDQSFPEMIKQALITRVQAGDIFCSGSPINESPDTISNPGDLMEIEIQVLGTLVTPVKEEKNYAFS